MKAKSQRVRSRSPIRVTSSFTSAGSVGGSRLSMSPNCNEKTKLTGQLEDKYDRLMGGVGGQEACGGEEVGEVVSASLPRKSA